VVDLGVARDVIEFAASVGLPLDEHQELVLEGALGVRADGKWAAFEVIDIEPRQNGKGDTKIARQLAGLFLFRERLQTHTAHRFDTCLEHFHRVREIVEGDRSLLRKVKRISDTNGKEMIQLLPQWGGCRLQFKARSKGSGRGFSGDTVYLDELLWLLSLGQLLPTMSARPNPQLWGTSSAPEPRAESDILRRYIRRGRAGDEPRMAYFEWSADGDVSLDDRGAWHDANPALGVRISEEFVENERKAMTDEEFARERLGIFPDPDAEAASWVEIGEHDWSRCGVRRLEPVDPVAMAIDCTPDRSASAIGASWRCEVKDVERRALQCVDSRPGDGWVVERAVELQSRWGPKGWVIDPATPARALVPDLEAAGLNVVLANTGDHAAACALVLSAVESHTAAHEGQPELDAAAAGARKRKNRDGFLWDRQAGVNIAPLVCVSLAAWGDLTIQVEEPDEPDFLVL
jgi:hypothetical protein